MKTMNNFQISGFVVNNATINQFATASVARFGISVRRTEKNGDSEKKVSAILNIEAWKINADAASAVPCWLAALLISGRSFHHAVRLHFIFSGDVIYNFSLQG